jgi:transposase-like protein
MSKAKRRVRCPYCHGLHTKRYGSFSINQGSKSRRRYYCYDCQRTFTLWTHQLTEEAVRLYFDTQASYRAVGRNLKIEPKAAYRRIIRMGFNCKSPLEVSLELKPQWSGYLVVDGDSVIVGKHRESLLLGADAYSQDIPHAILAESEDGINWMRFFLLLKDPIGYPLKGIISDGDPAISEAREAVFPDVPWQLCVRHFEKGLDRFLRYEFTQRRGYRREVDGFLKVVHNMLYAKSLDEARKYLLAISIAPGFKQARLSEVIGKVEKKFPSLVTHHLHPGMPRTSNIGEGVISRLDAKINQADGYQCHDTCWATLKMLIMWYRFKRFTDCRKRNKHKNGRSPLQLAKVVTQNINWISFSQKTS